MRHPGEEMMQGHENRAGAISCCVLIRANEVELASWLGLLREVVLETLQRVEKVSNQGQELLHQQSKRNLSLLPAS